MKKLIESWHALAQNVDQFFAKNSNGLTCSKGCSKCCEVDRTVFGIEAQVLIDSIENLDEQAYQNLKNELKSSHAKELGHCAFLKDGACLVYEARPLICRSHGLVHLRESGPHHCELNFEGTLPPKEQWIDEERLGTMLALLQREYEKSAEFPTRVSLHQIAELID